MLLTDLDTPALVLDIDAFEGNIQKMDALLKETGLALRPHYKSHKCARIARRQMEAGAVGISCAKLSEAEDLADAGIEDILIANQVVHPAKVRRLAQLAARCRLSVCVDDAANVRALGEAVRAVGAQLTCLVEYEVGMRRCGVDSPEEALALAREIEAALGLCFGGIQAYAGHLAHERDFTRRQAESRAIEEDLRGLKRCFAQNGLPPDVITGCSTGTVALRGEDSPYTDMQAGSYLFMDVAYAKVGVEFAQALYVLSSVVSVRGDRVVTDTGTKALGMDQENPWFVDVPRELPVAMSEEHSSFDLPGHSYRRGDTLLCIPGHCCTTVNLYDNIYVTQKGGIIDRWPVTSRGRAQ